jgi:hypothetical protein
MKRESRALCASHLLLEFGRTVEGFLLDWSTSFKLSHKNKKPSGFRLRVFLGVSPVQLLRCFFSRRGGG